MRLGKSSDVSGLEKFGQKENVLDRFAQVDEYKEDPKARNVKKIPLDKIRENTLNFYHIEEIDVEEMKRNIQEYGVNPGRVYHDVQDDGREYTLIGGATRYKALCALKAENQTSLDFPAYIVEKPETMEDELMLIMADNQQRTLNRQDQQEILKTYDRIYEEYRRRDKEINRQIHNTRNEEKKEELRKTIHIPEGTAKADWIAQRCGLRNSRGEVYSGSQMRRMLDGMNETPAPDKKPAKGEEQKAREKAVRSVNRKLKSEIDRRGLNRVINISTQKVMLNFDGSLEDLKYLVEELQHGSLGEVLQEILQIDSSKHTENTAGKDQSEETEETRIQDEQE